MISLENITIRAGNFAMSDVCLTVPTGAYAALMGKTGTGKTTLLEAVIGLRTVDAGIIRLDGRDVTHAPPAGRGVGYVPQDAALFSTMTVRQHLAFALEIRKADPQHISDRTEELADLLGLSHLLPRTPRGLSGGERQRVALGRALSFGPRTLLLDEPLSALDDDTRCGMIDLLKRVQHVTGATVLHVTHNQAEAQALADMIFSIRDGAVVAHAGTGIAGLPDQ
ncbi:MAG: ABC transporter ATP-binding protein [Planctomycetaceae bacterium]|nr:ABC transporter ATP-binding protein [Planctomycetaceae bacterium]